MPKLSYYKPDEDQSKTEITPSWLGKKINAVKMLLQGRLEQDNIIEETNANTIKRYTVIKDYPSDVVGYDNCAKFYTNEKNPYADIFQELVKLHKASPDVAVVGGTLDSEMSATFTVEQNEANDEDVDGDSCATSETYNLKKELEIPPNYVPMNWGELADLMVANGYFPKQIKIDTAKKELYLAEADAIPDDDTEKKNAILRHFNKIKSDWVETMNYWRDGESTNVNVNMVSPSGDKGAVWGHDVQTPVIQAQCSFPKCEFIQKRNVLSYSTYVKFEVNLGRVEPDDSVNDIKYLKSKGFSTVKLVPEILCKVI